MIEIEKDEINLKKIRLRAQKLYKREHEGEIDKPVIPIKVEEIAIPAIKKIAKVKKAKQAIVDEA